MTTPTNPDEKGLSLADELFAAIEHGDAEHRAWLRNKLNEFFANRRSQPVKGDDTVATKSERLRRLQAEVAQLAQEIVGHPTKGFDAIHNEGKGNEK